MFMFSGKKRSRFFRHFNFIRTQQESDPQTHLQVESDLFKKERKKKVSWSVSPLQSPDLNMTELGFWMKWTETSRWSNRLVHHTMLQECKNELTEHCFLERMPEMCSAVTNVRGGYVDGSRV